MPRPVLIDTDVMVDFLRGQPQAVALLDRAEPLLLSSVTVAELYAGVKGDGETQTLDRFIGLFRVIPVTTALARMGGLLKKTYAKSHGLGLADALVAAAAEAEQADLKTLNVRHFPMIRGLRPAYTKPS